MAGAVIACCSDVSMIMVSSASLVELDVERSRVGRLGLGMMNGCGAAGMSSAVCMVGVVGAVVVAVVAVGAVDAIGAVGSTC